MTPKALVIDDDPEILAAVADILESMGHECDTADSVETARQRLDCSEYTYVLLDLEIPVRAGRNLPRIQNGENLLEEIIERSGVQRTPIIVMTAHGTDGPELAVEIMKKGALDYVTKPFKTTGRTLDKSIREALARQCETLRPLPPTHHEARSETTQESTSELKPFDGGTLVFYPDRVELCGAIICDASRKSRRQRKALELLRVKVGERFERYDCERLAEELVVTGGPSAVPGFIRTLRNRIKKALLEQVNIGSRDEDVICSDCGYCLSEKLTAQDPPVVDSGQDQGHHKESRRPDVADDVSDPDVSNTHPSSGRKAWIIRRLEEGHQLKGPDVVREFACSDKTALRDLAALKDEGKIEFVGPTRTGYYRLCSPPETTG